MLKVSPVMLSEVSTFCGQCLEALYEDYDDDDISHDDDNGVIEHAREASRNDHKNAISGEVAAALIALFNEVSDDYSLRSLLHSSKFSVGSLPMSAFVMSSELLLRSGHFEEVLSHLEGEARLSNTGPRGSSQNDYIGVTTGSPLRMFGPAIEALAREGDLEVMMHLLLRKFLLQGEYRAESRKGMPSWPSTQLFLKAMDALNACGRPRDSLELFKIAIAGPEALTNVDDGNDGYPMASAVDTGISGEDAHDEGPVELIKLPKRGTRPYPSALKYPVSPALLDAAYRSCALGSLGGDALQILQLMGRSNSGFEVNIRHGVPVEGCRSAAAEHRNMLNIVTALANPEYITALPTVISYIRSSDRPLALSNRMHEQCLVAALWAGDEDVIRHFVNDQRHDEEEHRGLSVQEREHLLKNAMKLALQKFCDSETNHRIFETQRDRLESLVSRYFRPTSKPLGYVASTRGWVGEQIQLSRFWYVVYTWHSALLINDYSLQIKSVQFVQKCKLEIKCFQSIRLSFIHFNLLSD